MICKYCGKIAVGRTNCSLCCSKISASDYGGTIALKEYIDPVEELFEEEEVETKPRKKREKREKKKNKFATAAFTLSTFAYIFLGALCGLISYTVITATNSEQVDFGLIKFTVIAGVALVLFIVLFCILSLGLSVFGLYKFGDYRTGRKRCIVALIFQMIIFIYLVGITVAVCMYWEMFLDMFKNLIELLNQINASA